MKKKEVCQLLKCIEKFQLSDLIGFGKILDVPEQDDFVDYCTQICYNFSQENFLKRKQLLKLAKDIVVANDCMVAKGDGNGD